MASAFLFLLLVTYLHLASFHSLVCVECGICVCRPTLCRGKETSGGELECAVGPLKMLINSEQILAFKINSG